MLARKLEATGVATAQAQGVATALAETLGEHIASRRDRSDTEARLELRLREIEAGIRTLELTVRADMRELEQRMTIRLGGMLAAAIVLVGAMVKLL